MWNAVELSMKVVVAEMGDLAEPLPQKQHQKERHRMQVSRWEPKKRKWVLLGW